jgi:ribosome biogenesis protein YTM1
MAAAHSGADDAVASITVKFHTTFPHIRVPGAPISLPGNLNQLGLSKVIHHLIGSGEGFILPLAVHTAKSSTWIALCADEAADSIFEFFVNPVDIPAPTDSTAPAIERTFLRSSLLDYLKGLNISQEATVSMEYIPAMQPPSPGPNRDAPDWVSSLSATETYIVAGLSSGQLALYAIPPATAAASKLLVAHAPLTIAAHAGSVSGVHAFELEASSFVATSGHDFVVRLWQPSELAAKKASSALDAPVSLTMFAELNGCTATCGNVAVAPSGEHVAVGDWHGNVFVWDTPAIQRSGAAEASSSRPAKRQRKVSNVDEIVTQEVAPTFSLVSKHTGPVSSTTWVSSGTLASGSWDNSIKVWDIESGASEEASFLAPKAIHAISASPFGSVLATAHPDCSVRVWDTRSRTTAGVTSRIEGLRGSGRATAWVSSVSWCPSSSFHILHGAYDGSSAIWDIRSLSAPLFHLEKHEGQVLSVGWGGKDAKVCISGGSDYQLRTNHLPQVLG